MTFRFAKACNKLKKIKKIKTIESAFAFDISLAMTLQGITDARLRPLQGPWLCCAIEHILVLVLSFFQNKVKERTPT